MAYFQFRDRFPGWRQGEQKILEELSCLAATGTLGFWFGAVRFSLGLVDLDVGFTLLEAGRSTLTGRTRWRRSRICICGRLLKRLKSVWFFLKSSNPLIRSARSLTVLKLLLDMNWQYFGWRFLLSQYSLLSTSMHSYYHFWPLLPTRRDG